MTNNPHWHVLRKIKRGLAGYVSYLAACQMNSSFSEYVLYEPILRILTANGYLACCEKACPGYEPQRVGDKKRIDFEASHPVAGTFALEVKWAKQKGLNVTNDVGKLTRYRQASPNSQCFLCIFGKKSDIQQVVLEAANLIENGEAVYAEFGQTIFGCRVYRLT